MKCPNCGEVLEKGAKFCGNCGANVEQALNERVQKEAEDKKKAEKEIKEKIKNNTQKVKENNKVENENVSDPVVNKEIEKIKEEYEKKKIDEKETKKEIKKTKEEKNSEKKAEEKDENQDVENEPKFKKKEIYVKKSNNTGIRIFIILIIILLIIFGGSYQLYKMNLLPEGINDSLSPVFEGLEGKLKTNKESEEDPKILKEIKVEDKKDKITKKDKSKELVYDYYTTNIGDKLSRIPTINLDYENVEKINSEILEHTEKKLKEAEKIFSEEKSELVNVDYSWYQNDDLLSVIISLKYGTGKDEYYVYNINVTDGENIQNSKILKMADVSTEEFSDKCVKAVDDYFKKLYNKKDLIFGEMSGYEKAYDSTVDESNFSISKSKIYLNDKSELILVAKIYTLSEAGEDEKPLNLENLNENSIDED